MYGPRFRSVHVQLDEAATRRLDAVTEDLLIGLTADPEKQSWMLQAENRAARSSFG